MLNRLTVSALLKVVILATSFCVVVGFSLNAWDSWGRLQVANRISVIADASAYLFKAMHNLRTDRSTTERLLNSDAPMDADIEKYLRGLRDAEMPSMASALELLSGMQFAGSRPWCRSSTACSRLLTAEQQEFWERGRQAEGIAPRRAAEGIYGDDPGPARHSRQDVRRAGRRRQPPGRRRSTSCWRSSRSPGCCATPAAKPR